MINIKKCLTISLCLVLFLGVIGCNKISEDNPKVKQESQTQEKEEKTNPSFPIETYSSPFFEFNYPADWKIDPDTEMPDMDTVVVYKGYVEEPYDDTNMVYIMIGRKNDTNFKTAVEARDISLGNLEILIKEGKCELKGTGIINNNIAVLDAVQWDEYPIRIKTYYYTNGEGRFYMAAFCTCNENWDKTEEIIKVFEESLKFKQ